MHTAEQTETTGTPPGYLPTPRTTPTRLRERAQYDRVTVHRILDEALICHFAYVTGGRPVVLPTFHARVDETLYLHASTGSGPLLALKASPTGLEVCVTVTLVDGLVLARSAFHHSLNYRSVVVVGTPRLVQTETEKRRALDALVDHVVPGRSHDTRRPTGKELAATAVLALDLNEVSAKVRAGDPGDDLDDMALPHWAGVVPLTLAAGTPMPAADLDPAVPLPPYLEAYRRT